MLNASTQHAHLSNRNTFELRDYLTRFPTFSSHYTSATTGVAT
jgi:hypothetical protein